MAWGDATARPAQGALGRSLPGLYTGTLPLHLYAIVDIPPDPTATDKREGKEGKPTTRGTEQQPRARHNLEGLVARLRGYVGGSYTQMLHRRPAFEEYIRTERARDATTLSQTLPSSAGPNSDADSDVDASPPAGPSGPREGGGGRNKTILGGLLRCCPYEHRSCVPPPRGPGLSHPPARWAGTSRHVALLCAEPGVTRVREAMWDAAENGLRTAAQGVRVGEAPAGAAAPMEPGRGGDRQDRRDYTRAPTIAQRPDSRRRPAWTTLTGILSHTRWPSLTALNWLLPSQPRKASPTIQH